MEPATSKGSPFNWESAGLLCLSPLPLCLLTASSRTVSSPQCNPLLLSTSWRRWTPKTVNSLGFHGLSHIYESRSLPLIRYPDCPESFCPGCLLLGYARPAFLFPCQAFRLDVSHSIGLLLGLQQNSTIEVRLTFWNQPDVEQRRQSHTQKASHLRYLDYI
ncbi:uncharacterized protein BDV17DRAFT_152670 [Aspergillus undulatus]|uniref:uncharacterized protein n=1 Tax=Aspergillus undulatus TaxID=1810928 RepID=UPI003CCDEE84